MMINGIGNNNCAFGAQSSQGISNASNHVSSAPIIESLQNVGNTLDREPISSPTEPPSASTVLIKSDQSQIQPQQAAQNVFTLQTLRDKTWETYGVPPSKWPRQYPPISGADTPGIASPINKEKAQELISYIKQYANQHGISLPEFDSKIKSLGFCFYIGDINDPSGDDFLMSSSREEILLKAMLRKIAPELANLSTSGAYGYSLVFADSEIVNLHEESITREVTRKSASGEPRSPFVFKEIDGKAVILQQATRGCTAAVAMMLIQDNGGEIDTYTLEETNLGNAETMTALLRKAGFDVLKTDNPTLESLQNAITEHGPAIVSLGLASGGHVVIVDAIDLEKNVVTIRDPAHGWMIDIKQDVFLGVSMGESINGLHLKTRN